MAAVKVLNPKAELARAGQVLSINKTAATGLQEVLRSNLGPKGTLKMLVSGAGDIKITKDGNVLLHEMQIQHPTATLIARVATAQDDVTGDGTTSIVLLIGEMFKQADIFIEEGLHPRIVKDGFDMARDKALEVLDKLKVSKIDRNTLLQVARTSLSTKLHHEMAEMLTEQVVEAVQTVKQDGKQLNLHMIEIVEMQHKTDMDTTLIKGLVLDHGGRHPDMKKRAEDCYILTCNVSFEYEKTEVNAGLFYKTSEEREKMISAERAYIDARVQKVVDLKNKLCDGNNKNFVVINQKGVDPPALDAFAKAGIIALRRAKRRNMERLPLVCGGVAVNSVDDLTPDVLGKAGLVYEHVLGEDKYTFVEQCENPRSLTLVIKGPNKHTITQIKDAVKDGLMAVRNAMEDQTVVPGAGAFELAVYDELMKFKDTVKGRAKLGVQCFAEALLIIPKVLAQNAGYDAQDTIVTLLEEAKQSKTPIGVDVTTGKACVPADLGILDNYCVKRQILTSACTIATNMLLVDEIMKAGVSTQQSKAPQMAQ